MLPSLLETPNFLFFLPLMTGLLLGVVIAFTGIGGDGGDATNAESGDTLALAGADGGSDLADASSGGDGDDFDLEVTPSAAPYLQLLSFMGIGRGVPLSVMLPILFVIWGIGGLVLNEMLEPLLVQPLYYLPLSIVGAFLLASYTGQGVSALLRRLFRTRPHAVGSSGLVGLMGRAVYAVTADGGVAHVRDAHGNLHRLVCKVYPDAPPIGTNEDILVVEFSDKERVYYVVPYGE